MIGVRERIEVALEEARMLILVSEVMLGLHYRAAFEPALAALSPAMRQLEIAAMALMLAALALFALPVSFRHAGGSSGEARAFAGLARRSIVIALIPFAASMTVTVFVTAARLAGPAVAAALAAVLVLATLGLGLGLHATAGARHMPDRGEFPRIIALPPGPRVVEIDRRVDGVLAEARLALPGALILLGFQLSAALANGFDQATVTLRAAALGSFVSIVASVILLAAPSAYHRIAERGASSERFLRLARRLLAGAFAALALGLTGNTFVAVARITGSVRFAAVAALCAATGFFALWFVFPMLRGASLGHEPRIGMRRKEARV